MIGLFAIACFFSFTTAQNWRKFGSTEYFVGQEQVEFAIAKMTCENMFSTLVVINSENVRNFLEEIVADGTCIF